MAQQVHGCIEVELSVGKSLTCWTSTGLEQGAEDSNDYASSLCLRILSEGENRIMTTEAEGVGNGCGNLSPAGYVRHII